MTHTDPELLLRPATVGDADAMARVRERARRAAPMPLGLTGAGLVDELASARPGDELWVAEREDVVVGYARFVRPDAVRQAWLDDLYVDPAHAGQGIGGSLLGVVKARLVGGFGLWVFERNLDARAFYAVHGLVEHDRVSADASPEQEPELHLVWPGRTDAKESSPSPTL